MRPPYTHAMQEPMSSVMERILRVAEAQAAATITEVRPDQVGAIAAQLQPACLDPLVRRMGRALAAADAA